MILSPSLARLSLNCPDTTPKKEGKEKEKKRKEKKKKEKERKKREMKEGGSVTDLRLRAASEVSASRRKQVVSSTKPGMNTEPISERSLMPSFWSTCENVKDDDEKEEEEEEEGKLS